MAATKTSPKAKTSETLPHPIVTKFSERMRSHRERRKLTQEALADRMDCSVSYVSMLEMGKRNPPLTTVHLVATSLGCTVAALVG